MLRVLQGADTFLVREASEAYQGERADHFTMVSISPLSPEALTGYAYGSDRRRGVTPAAEPEADSQGTEPVGSADSAFSSSSSSSTTSTSSSLSEAEELESLVVRRLTKDIANIY